MVKFGKYLLSESVAEWRDRYLNYKKGKKLLKKITAAILQSHAATEVSVSSQHSQHALVPRVASLNSSALSGAGGSGGSGTGGAGGNSSMVSSVVSATDVSVLPGSRPPRLRLDGGIELTSTTGTSAAVTSPSAAAVSAALLRPRLGSGLRASGQHLYDPALDLAAATAGNVTVADTVGPVADADALALATTTTMAMAGPTAAATGATAGVAAESSLPGSPLDGTAQRHSPARLQTADVGAPSDAPDSPTNDDAPLSPRLAEAVDSPKLSHRNDGCGGGGGAGSGDESDVGMDELKGGDTLSPLPPGPGGQRDVDLSVTFGSSTDGGSSNGVRMRSGTGGSGGGGQQPRYPQDHLNLFSGKAANDEVKERLANAASANALARLKTLEAGVNGGHGHGAGKHGDSKHAGRGDGAADAELKPQRPSFELFVPNGTVAMPEETAFFVFIQNELEAIEKFYLTEETFFETQLQVLTEQLRTGGGAATAQIGAPAKPKVVADPQRTPGLAPALAPSRLGLGSGKASRRTRRATAPGPIVLTTPTVAALLAADADADPLAPLPPPADVTGATTTSAPPGPSSSRAPARGTFAIRPKRATAPATAAATSGPAPTATTATTTSAVFGTDMATATLVPPSPLPLALRVERPLLDLKDPTSGLPGAEGGAMGLATPAPGATAAPGDMKSDATATTVVEAFPVPRVTNTSEPATTTTTIAFTGVGLDGAAGGSGGADGPGGPQPPAEPAVGPAAPGAVAGNTTTATTAVPTIATGVPAPAPAPAPSPLVSNAGGDLSALTAVVTGGAGPVGVLYPMADGLSSHDHAELKKSCEELYRGLHLLKNYRILNYTGFVKILKKHDKISTFKRGGALVLPLVAESVFCTSTKLHTLMADLESIYVNCFAGGDRKTAMSRLRGKAPELSQWVSFGIGLSVGIVLCVMLAIGMTWNFSTAFSQSDWFIAAFPVFRGATMIVLHFWLYGICMHYMDVYKINYGFILEADPDTRLSYSQVLEFAAFLSLFLFVSIALMCLSVASLLSPEAFVFGANPGSIHLTFFLTFLAVMFCPFDWFFKSTRVFFFKALLRVIGSGLFTVSFMDFLLADQLCSQVKLMFDFTYGICLYSTGAFLEPNKSSQCNVVANNGMWVLACMPMVWRFLQCCRRWRDTGNAYPHMVNGLKYMTSVSVTLLNLLQSKFHSHWFEAWITMAVVSTCFSFYWDIRMDWGLVQFERGSAHPLLRRNRVVDDHTWVYYAAMVLDLCFRVLWVMTISPTLLGGGLTGSFYSAGLQAAEIVRRCMWTFFRFENEHLNNCGQYRAVRAVPHVGLKSDGQVLSDIKARVARSQQSTQQQRDAAVAAAKAAAKAAMLLQSATATSTGTISAASAAPSTTLTGRSVTERSLSASTSASGSVASTSSVFVGGVGSSGRVVSPRSGAVLSPRRAEATAAAADEPLSAPPTAN